MIQREGTRRKKAYLGSEQQLQNSIIEGLQYRGFWTQRINSGKLKSTWDYSGKTPKQYSSWVQLFPKGTPDILAIKQGQAWWFEVKKIGEKSTDIQLAVQSTLRAAGCHVYEVHSWSEVEEKL